ncbi:UDP pyrophosphate phosphatase [Bacillus coahuilensis p1.1.43]|uniref:Undecaprenyl-diphosphatase n=1 Tax=Bacillus coahuilensis p1.1.43 TaxID=1150625 RepID=A0A147K5K1_9BACI|nr:undecaprenyl-diphosphate phosphatase [Bacillus coahuilensis]KUP04913.1 UDP pyrophosphate phosphatase [Bacillus coahuilensis p1.1.43]
MLNEWIIAIILGILEGLTEFLPVSSTGHLILAANLLEFHGETAKTFEVVIQLGAVLAVLILYWKRFVSFLSTEQFEGNQLNLVHIALAMLPAVVVGLLLHSFIKAYLFGPETVLVGLVVGGIFMIVAEKLKKTPKASNLDEITYRQAFGIGMFQCFALWPGFSRSGSTIAGGILLGVNHRSAAEFTFLVSVPIMMAATGLDIVKSLDTLVAEDFALFGVGFLTSFIVAMIAIKTFLHLLKKLSLSVFAYYRFVLAAVYFFIVL